MDAICRLGGDEFTVILPETGDRAEVQRIAERLLEFFDTPFPMNSGSIRLQISVGIGIFPDDGDDIEMLLKRRTSPCTARRNTKGAFCLLTERAD